MGVKFNNQIPRNPGGYYSDVNLVGSETGKIITADKKALTSSMHKCVNHDALKVNWNRAGEGGQ